MTWQVIQHRYIKDSDQNDRPNVVWEGGRVKDARGQAKSNLKSHLEMLMKHEFFEDADLEIDLENHSAAYWQDGQVIYSIRYDVVSIED